MYILTHLERSKSRKLLFKAIIVWRLAAMVSFVNVTVLLLHSLFILSVNYLTIWFHLLKEKKLIIKFGLLNHFFFLIHFISLQHTNDAYTFNGYSYIYYFKKIFCGPFISLTNWNPHKLGCVYSPKLGHISIVYNCKKKSFSWIVNLRGQKYIDEWVFQYLYVGPICLFASTHFVGFCMHIFFLPMSVRISSMEISSFNWSFFCYSKILIQL